MNQNGWFQNVKIAAPLAMVCCLVLSGSAARAQDQSNNDQCSNRTIRGDYGFKIDGTLINGPRTGLLRAVAMTNFDGKGNLTQVDFGVTNGVPNGPDWRAAKGTYTVNADCTGSFQFVPIDGSPAVNVRMVVVKNGKEIHTVVIGNPTGSVGYRAD